MKTIYNPLICSVNDMKNDIIYSIRKKKYPLNFLNTTYDRNSIKSPYDSIKNDDGSLYYGHLITKEKFAPLFEIKQQQDIFDWMFNNIEIQNLYIENILDNIENSSYDILNKSHRIQGNIVLVGENIYNLIKNNIDISNIDAINNISDEFLFVGDYKNISIYISKNNIIGKDMYIMTINKSIESGFYCVEKNGKKYFHILDNYENYTNNFSQYISIVNNIRGTI